MQKELKLNATDKEKLELVKNLLEENFDSVPSIKILCRKSGLNEDKLKRGFKELYGMPPHQFQRQLRMREARRLLLETDQPVSEIAYSLGYEQSSNFSTAFRKFSGNPPQATRLQKQ